MFDIRRMGVVHWGRTFGEGKSCGDRDLSGAAVKPAIHGTNRGVEQHMFTWLEVRKGGFETAGLPCDVAGRTEQNGTGGNCAE